MEIREYYDALGSFAKTMECRGCAAHELLDELKGRDQLAMNCASFRENMLEARESEALSAYLEIGYFLDPSPTTRIAWYAFSNDLARIAQERATLSACERYDVNQPLFKAVPKLFNSIRKRAGQNSSDLELIDEADVACIDDTEIYKVCNKFAKLSPYLSPCIPAWARQAYPEASKFIRLDPHKVFEAKPSISLLEAALVPADPRWMENLELHVRTNTYASYQLLPDNGVPGSLEYFDYHVSGVRRLEVQATRREEDYLSMMIEELPQEDDSSGLMIGRCLHLDTRAPFGTALTKSRLQHLDLAINVYKDETRKKRMENTLQHGKSQAASYRTHLYRIEDVPMAALFVFAGLFLRSKSLLSEWMSATLNSNV